MNLDQAWTSAQKLKAETDKASEALKNHGKAHQEASIFVKGTATAEEIAAAATKAAKEEYTAANRELAQTKKAYSLGTASAADLATAQDRVRLALKGLHPEFAATGVSVRGMSTELTAANRNLAETKKAYALGSASAADLSAAQDRVKAALVASHPEFDASTEKVKKFSMAMLDHITKSDEMRKQTIITTAAFTAFVHSFESGAFADGAIKISEIGRALKELPPHMDPLLDLTKQMPAVMGAWKDSLDVVGDAYKTLGIRSAASLTDEAQKSRAAYENIRLSGVGTAHDIQAAWVVMEQDRQAAAIAAGQVISTAEKKMLADTKSSINDQEKSYEALGGSIGRAVSTVMTDLSRGIADAIFNVKSFGDLFKRVGEDIVKAILRTIIERGFKVLLDTLSNVSGVIGKIAKDMGGVADIAKKIGGTVLGGSGEVLAEGSAIPGIAEAAGQGSGEAAGAIGSAGSTATGAAGGLSSLVSGFSIAGAIGSMVGAVSGIIGNFQQAHADADLTKIEKSTRYSEIYLGEQSQSILWSTQTTAERLNYVNASLNTLKDNFSSLLGMTSGKSGGDTYNISVAVPVGFSSTQMNDLGQAIVRQLKLAGAV